MPNMADPLRRVGFTKSEIIFNHMKEACGIEADLIMNPRDQRVRKEQLYECAKLELGEDAPVLNQSMTAIAKAIVDKRIEDKTYLGFSTLHKVSISATNPFTVTILPGRTGKKIFRMKFHVKKFVFHVERHRGITLRQVW
jgi:hypothetical protein